MRSSLTLASRVTLFALIGITLVGCATSRRDDLWFQHMGMRPDEPKVETSKPACDAYTDYATYAQKLQEAYHSRATQNRFWIYAAGILGLGAAAASGGLAAAAAGATTIALVAISGGFAAGTFAAIDNSELAKIYTIVANKIDTTLVEADRQLRGATTPAEGCSAALGTLKDGVSEARITLEVARTNNAAGALIRAKEEQKVLAKLIESVEESNPTRVTMSASITSIDPATFPDVVLTVNNIQLDRVAPAEVKVVVGSADPVSARATKTDEFIYSVKFRAPDIPSSSGKSYTVTLLVGKSKERVTSTNKLAYP